MSPLEQYRLAVKAQPLPGLAAIASAAAKDFGAGNLTWDDLAEVNDLIQARRDRAKAAPEPKPPRVHKGATPRTPESIDRRREWAGGNELPASFRGKFSMAQLGVVKFLLRLCFEQGACRLPIEAIAAKVGTCKTVVREAVRKAVGYGLIESKEHRRSYWRNDPNTIRIVSQEVKYWLRIGAEMAKRAAGIAVRVKAQAGKAWHQRKADDRRALKTLRGEARTMSEKIAAEARAAERADSASRADGDRGSTMRQRMATEMLDKLRKGGGSRFAKATPESSLREETPSAATQPSEENCPNGSSTSGGGLFAAARRAAQNLGLHPEKCGIPPKIDEADTLRPILEGVSYHWT